MESCTHTVISADALVAAPTSGAMPSASSALDVAPAGDFLFGAVVVSIEDGPGEKHCIVCRIPLSQTTADELALSFGECTRCDTNRRLRRLAEVKAMAAAEEAKVLPADIYKELTTFDDRLVEMLDASVIRLVCSAWFLAQPAGFVMPYRQQLEELERSCCVLPPPLLSPKEASKLIRLGNRGVGSATHGWLSPGKPDPAGMRMQLLRQELKARPYIVGFFFECAQLQNTRVDACVTFWLLG